MVGRQADGQLDPAAVDDETLIGDACAVFSSEEKNKASYFDGADHPLQCLPGEDFGFVGRSHRRSR